LAVARFVEESVNDVGVPALGCFYGEDGWAREVAEKAEVIVGAEDETMYEVETT
jgi:hypothetical protein